MNDELQMVKLQDAFRCPPPGQNPTPRAVIDGYAVRAFMVTAQALRKMFAGGLTGEEWRGLDTLRSQDADISAKRAMRNGLGVPDQAAGNLLALLFAKGWVEKAPVKGSI